MMAFLTMLQAMMAGGGGLDHEGLSKVIPCKRSSGVSCPCSSFVLGFGRFKGKNLEELPRSYVQWMAGSVSDKPDVIKAVNCFLGHVNEGEKGRTKNSYERKDSLNRSAVRVDVWREGQGNERLPLGGSPTKRDEEERREIKEKGDEAEWRCLDENSSKTTCKQSATFSLSLSDWSHRWGLDEQVASVFLKRGISSLFEWQVECINTSGILHGRNLVLSAPTSAGKTLVSDVLLLRNIARAMQTESTRAKAMLVLPYVSLAQEKTLSLKPMASALNIKVTGFYAGKGGPFAGTEPEIAVCTIEKANSLVNRLMEENRQDVLALVVVDEAHLISDEQRGFLLELLLAKILASTQAQVLCMSATISNPEDLASWLNASVYKTNFRPIDLAEYIFVNGNVLPANLLSDDKCNSIPFSLARRRVGPIFGMKDPDLVGALAFEAMKNGQSTLIFCSSKSATESCAKFLAGLFGQRENRRIAVRVSDEVAEKRLMILEELARCEGGLDPSLKATIPQGAAFHHAGLTLEERTILENGFRAGIILVLAATSTLAAGVNLPASRVILRSPHVGMETLDSMRYKQMSGRAGRTGLESMGESYLMIKSTQWALAKSVMLAPLPQLTSCLLSAGHGILRRMILEAVVHGLAPSLESLKTFMRKTLLFVQDKDMFKHLRGALDWLERKDFLSLKQPQVLDIDNSTCESVFVEATALGQATVSSGLAPEQGLQVYADLSIARKGLVLSDEAHLLFLLTPVYHGIQPSYKRYLDMVKDLPAEIQTIAQAVGVDEDLLAWSARQEAYGVLWPQGTVPPKYKDKMNVSSNTSNVLIRRVEILERFWVTLMLRDLILEAPIQDVCSRYKMSRGTVQTLQGLASTFSGQVSIFCSKLHWWQLQVLCSSFQERLEVGGQPDIISLARIPHVKNVRARALFNAGLMSVSALSMSLRLPQDHKR